jgi:hypothetical protein
VCYKMRVRKLLLIHINRKQLRYLISGELHTGPEYSPLEVYYTNMEVRWKPSHYLLNNNMVLWVYWEMGCLGVCLFSPSFSAKKLQQSSIHGTPSRCLNGAKCIAGIWHLARATFILNLASSTRAEVQVAKEYHSVLSCSEAPQRTLPSKLSYCLNPLKVGNSVLCISEIEILPSKPGQNGFNPEPCNPKTEI